MYYLDTKDLIVIALKSLILSIIIVSLIVGSAFLIKSNFDFANYVCDITKIPRDLSLTVMSLGFRNNMVVLLSVFEFGIVFYLYGKLKNTKIYKRVYEIFVN